MNRENFCNIIQLMFCLTQSQFRVKDQLLSVNRFFFFFRYAVEVGVFKSKYVASERETVKQIERRLPAMLHEQCNIEMDTTRGHVTNS